MFLYLSHKRFYRVAVNVSNVVGINQTFCCCFEISFNCVCFIRERPFIHFGNVCRLNLFCFFGIADKYPNPLIKIPNGKRFLFLLSEEFYHPVTAKEFSHTNLFCRTPSRDNRRQFFLYQITQRKIYISMTASVFQSSDCVIGIRKRIISCPSICIV